MGPQFTEAAHKDRETVTDLEVAVKAFRLHPKNSMGHWASRSLSGWMMLPGMPTYRNVFRSPNSDSAWIGGISKAESMLHLR